MITVKKAVIIFETYNNMTITVITPTGSATINNAQSQKGQKAMLSFMQQVQRERVPFIVLPPNTMAHDLHDITSIDSNYG